MTRINDTKTEAAENNAAKNDAARTFDTQINPPKINAKKKKIFGRFLTLPFLAAIMTVMLFATSSQAFSAAVSFSDVNRSDWFYEPVMTLAGEGIVNGYADGTYLPGNSVTKAEALKMILQAAEIPVRETDENEYWAAGIFEAAFERGITSESAADGAQAATREEIAGYIVRAMDWTHASFKESIFADTNDTNVNILYTKDIVTGSKESDGYYFYPRNQITRAELSTIIVRLSGAQKERTGQTAYTVKDPLKDPECFMKEQPLSADDFAKALLNMAKNKDYTHTFIYPKSYGLSTDATIRNNVMGNVEEAYGYVFSRYPEYFAVTGKIHMSMSSSSGRVSLTLELGNHDFSQEEMIYMQNTFESDCDGIAGKLIAGGSIRGGMSDVEKAKAIFAYVACNNKYDLSLAPASYTGYGATHNGTSVCQGYAAMFNMICKKCGLVVSGITGEGQGGGTTEDHMWSLTMLDGEWSHTDVTYADPVPDRAGRYLAEYFNASSAKMKKDHSWETSEYPI
ncbi:MAG: S-layer homology domain-containing protein [Clostridia bacterium]|nr:S-layer homology domain-containing protein [Clostridia bacterium]